MKQWIGEVPYFHTKPCGYYVLYQKQENRAAKKTFSVQDLDGHPLECTKQHFLTLFGINLDIFLV